MEQGYNAVFVLKVEQDNNPAPLLQFIIGEVTIQLLK